MQLNKEYKMDNLAYKFYPHLLDLNFLLLEYWQEDNGFLSVFITVSLDHFLEYLKFTFKLYSLVATGQSNHMASCLFSDW